MRSSTSITLMTIIASAEPKGQLRAARNCCSMRLPSIITLAPPRMAGTTKLPSAGIKTMIAPPTMPGAVSGRMTRQKVRTGPAPRSSEARTSVQSSFSTLA
ncbi:hypothetical protein D3C87_1975120 [compost metagenome]